MALWDPEAAGNAAIYLRLPDVDLIDIRNAPFEGKTAVWVPYSETGYTKGKKLEDKGDKVEVERLVDGKVKEYKKEQVEPQNPPKYELLEDLANMTHLSEATVVHNLSERYCRFLIYTYSGLFCVTVNPYKWLPVYDNHVVGCYKNKRKTEMPPHVYSVSDNAYNDMLRNRENQSMLITGESGAGKTVNTKRVIQFFAIVAATADAGSGAPALKGGGTLEDQIVAANPAMEAYGNAKTIRNDNSSRFGKFIRIHFNSRGTLASGDIDTYLLEKSRVTFQLPAERCFHIFYQMCTGHKPQINEMCAVSTNPRDYKWCSLGEIKVKSIDDTVELDATDESFDILGFDQSEKDAIYMITAGIMHSGNVAFRNKPREEQAEAETTAEAIEAATQVARLFGIDKTEYMKAMCSPRVKVGTEYVTKGQTVQQCIYSLGALTKAIFGRLFDWLVKVINRALSTDMPRDFFIGILDIAGFEIFEFNTFEQLCINYTNERLQQFFNHHMFILEQEEYKSEGIDWVFEDFGMDLQASLDLIEKPLGIMSLLEEECMVPKGTDMTYKDKLIKQHLGKSTAFGKIKKKGKIEAHFELYHYAGTVQYNVVDWLLKNKDPLNTSVVGLYKKSSVKVVQEIWESYVSPEDAPKGGGKGKGGKRQKGGSFQTVSALHRESLNRLMTNLKATQPHFIRCIIPNEIKKPGYMENNLVLHQLRCNGVLEGIRICRKGFPSRVIYDEWRQRYTILQPQAVPPNMFIDAKKACERIISKITEVNPELYRFGHTKLFFKAGVIGQLEDLRDDKISAILTALQTRMRFNISRARFLKTIKERDGAVVIQSNWRGYITLKDWEWQKLLFKIKPLLNTAEKKKEMEVMKDEYEKMTKELADEKAQREKLEKEHRELLMARNKLNEQQFGDSTSVVDLELQYAMLQETKSKLEDKVKELQERLEVEEEINVDYRNRKNKLLDATKEYKTLRDALKNKVGKVEEENQALASDLRVDVLNLKDNKDLVSELERQCVNLENERFLAIKKLQDKESQVHSITQQITRLQQVVDGAEIDFELEKKSKDEMDKLCKKIEAEVRLNNETVMDIRSDQERLTGMLDKAADEYLHMNERYEDAMSSVCQLQQKIKELLTKIDKREEDLDIERSLRAKADRAKNELELEYKSRRDAVNECHNAIQKQNETNKKLVIQINKLERDLEEKKIGLKAAMDGLRKKFADQHADMIQEVSELERHNQKLERETEMYKEQAASMKARIDEYHSTRAANEREISAMEDENKSLGVQIVSSEHNLTEMFSNKARMITEIAELKRTLNEKDSVQQILFRNKNNMIQLQESLKKQIEDQTKAKQNISVNLARSRADHGLLEDQFNQEKESTKEVRRQYESTQNELENWKGKYENDAVNKAAELEDDRKKLTIRVDESEQLLQKATTKSQNFEKSKTRLQQEIKDLSGELERAMARVSSIEKRQRSFDKTLSEEDEKFLRITNRLREMLEARKAEVHQVFQMKQQLDQYKDDVEFATKEGKVLVEEVADLKDQLSEGNKSMAELEKAKYYLEKEKNELLKTLSSKEDLLEQLQAKVVQFQLSLKKVKSDCDKIVDEKDVEADTIRKSAHHNVVKIQEKLEEEIRTRADIAKQKKKVEMSLADLESGITNNNKQLSDLGKHNKELQVTIKEKQMELEQNDRIQAEVAEQRVTMERRMTICESELEDLRDAVEKADKLKKASQLALNDAKEQAALLTSQNTALHNQKRKYELQLQLIANEVEESFDEAKFAMEKSKKANFEAAQLGEQYKKAKDITENLLRHKSQLDMQIKSLQERLTEQEDFNHKGGKRSAQKLNDDIRDLVDKLEQKRKANEESTKLVKKMERKYKDAVLSLEEDRKLLIKTEEEYESNKIRSRKMKNSIEEIESQIMQYASKSRKLTSDLEEVEDRVDHHEQTLDIIWGKK